MINPIKLPEKINQAQFGNAEVYKNPQNKQPTDKNTAFSIFDQEKQKRESEVYNHESLHKAAGGSQAGPIVIDRDSNGVATSGHVNISMPTAVNPAKPDETKQQAETAYNSATAVGGDMSDADKSVAGNAQSILSQAQSFISQNGSGPCGQDGHPAKGKKLNLMG